VAPAPARAVRAERRVVREERSRRVVREASRSRAVERDTVVRQGDYARVHTPDYPPQDLLGAPPAPYYREQREYAHGARPAPHLPPLPPVERYEKRGHGYAQREQYGREEGYARRPHPPAPPPFVPPPPPPLPPAPPPHAGHGYDREYAQGGTRYGRRESYSSSEYERRSYSSSSSSSSYGSGAVQGGYGCPQRCPPRGGPVMAPMNGPHFPVDADGFLTWRGKSY
jgi:hypothetical protein